MTTTATYEYRARDRKGGIHAGSLEGASAAAVAGALRDKGFVPLRIEHPLFMLLFLVLTCVTFSLFGFVLGIWADGFERLQIVPLLIITPLTFLGGTFYSINVLPPFWQKVTLFNPVVYLVSGFRWSFFGMADVSVAVSLVMTVLFLAICLAVVWWIFKTGYRLKS